MPFASPLTTSAAGALRTAVLLTSVCGLFPEAQAQPYYQRTIGSFVEDDGYTVAAMPDSGLVIGGNSYGFVTGTNSSEMYATRFNRAGDMLWSRHYDCGIVSYALGLAATDSGGLVISGSNNGYQGLLIKVDSQGIPVWGWGTTNVERFMGVSISDSGMVFTTGSSSGSNADAHVEKFNTDGSFAWGRKYGTAYADEANGIGATSDGGALIGGRMLTGGGEYDAFLMKVGATGALQWSRTIGRAGESDAFNAVCECASGGYLAVGSSGSSTPRLLAVRYDAAGDTLWARRLDLFGGRCHSVEEVPGGYLVGGVVHGGYAQPFVMLLNEAGEVVWERTFSGGDSQSGEGTAARLADGSIAILGISWDVGPGMRDHFLIVTDSTGMGTVCAADSGSLDVLPSEWVLTSFGEELGGSGCTPFLPLSAPAGTLLQTECGTVSVPEELVATAWLTYEASTRILSITGCPAPGRLEVFDGLGRALAIRSIAPGNEQVVLPATAQGVLHVRLLASGAVVYHSSLAAAGQ